MKSKRVDVHRALVRRERISEMQRRDQLTHALPGLGRWHAADVDVLGLAADSMESGGHASENDEVDLRGEESPKDLNELGHASPAARAFRSLRRGVAVA